MDPSLRPPPDGDVSRAGELWGASLGTVLIVSVLVLTRLFTRTLIVKQFGWDDGTMILAFVSCSSYFNRVLVTERGTPC